jgi:hypothetical protein
MQVDAENEWLRHKAIELGEWRGVHLYNCGVGFKSWADAQVFIELVNPPFEVKIIERDTTRLSGFAKTVTDAYEVVALEKRD